MFCIFSKHPFKWTIFAPSHRSDTTTAADNQDTGPHTHKHARKTHKEMKLDTTNRSTGNERQNLQQQQKYKK